VAETQEGGNGVDGADLVHTADDADSVTDDWLDDRWDDLASHGPEVEVGEGGSGGAQGNNRATELSAAARMPMLRCAIWNMHAFPKPDSDSWTCMNCQAQSIAMVKCNTCNGGIYCPACDVALHTKVHVTRSAIHHRIGLISLLEHDQHDHVLVKQHTLQPLQFLQFSDASSEGAAPELRVVEWSELNLPKHPVLMPCRATCPKCLAAGSFLPDITGVDKFSEVELKSMGGSAKVHLCKWKCSNCDADLQDVSSDVSGISNGTSWLVLAHSVLPTTTLKATVVYEWNLLEMLHCVEAAHKSQNVSSLGAALELYYCNTFAKHLGRPCRSETTCLRGLRAAMELWKSVQHGVRMACNQNPFHCPGCTHGCPNANSDANMKLVQMNRENTIYGETGALYPEGYLPQADVKEVQELYGQFRAESKQGNAGAGVGCMDPSSGTPVAFKAAESGGSATTGLRYGGKRINGLFAVVCGHGVALKAWPLTGMNENAGHHALAAWVAQSAFRYVDIHTLDLNCVFGNAMLTFKQWLSANPEVANDFVRKHYVGYGDTTDRALGSCPHMACSRDDMRRGLDSHCTDFDLSECEAIFDGMSKGGFAAVEELLTSLTTHGVKVNDDDAFRHTCCDPDWAGAVSSIIPLPHPPLTASGRKIHTTCNALALSTHAPTHTHTLASY
jgi:hypothetical protein